MAVVLVGTLDTKGAEIAFVRDLLQQAEVATLVIDAGVLQPPLFAPDIPRQQVFAAASTNLAAIQRGQDRGRAITAAAQGIAKIVQDLHSRGRVEGILG